MPLRILPPSPFRVMHSKPTPYFSCTGVASHRSSGTGRAKRRLAWQALIHQLLHLRLMRFFFFFVCAYWSPRCSFPSFFAPTPLFSLCCMRITTLLRFPLLSVWLVVVLHFFLMWTRRFYRILSCLLYFPREYSQCPVSTSFFSFWALCLLYTGFSIVFFFSFFSYYFPSFSSFS
jgi:hypothetical protein